MSFRTVVVEKRSKLDLRMGYLVIRQEEDTRRVFLDEINTLIVENPACSVTGCLLAELAARKIKVIFCDEKRNPSFELTPYHGSHDCSLKLRRQIEWTDFAKKYIWTEIIAEKIRRQALTLQSFRL